MAYDLDSSRSELVRLHNPWEKFIQRDETKHHGDAARLNPTQAQTSTVIHQFMTHDSNQLDIPIPRKQQTLRDFLNESIIKAARGQNRTVENDVDDASLSTDIVLLDDRQKHPTCAKNYGKQCRECNIYSKNLTIPLLFCRLKEDVSAMELLRLLAIV
ncbi:hypothetical protein BDV95DRAFT_86163 [Massariosphaeria phaeospora]|uniref:Uncharacterized protein n=1 Tax=Massariosphaeria phaeospora TaxID=100035 RepID=A0A7C8I6X8_9PLEO|nr:hypothetical protein BDV95DRAFT_86163 [Massariosphaeria phaeospora]